MTKKVKAKKPKLFELEVYECLCSPSKFIVKGKDAEYYDFGTKEDIDAANAEPYGCGNMQFIRYGDEPARDKCLKKYKLTRGEFEKICDALEDKLSFGSCGWCV